MLEATTVERIRGKYITMASQWDERAWRRRAAAEVRELGWGGIAAVVRWYQIETAEWGEQVTVVGPSVTLTRPSAAHGGDLVLPAASAVPLSTERTLFGGRITRPKVG